MSRRKDTSSSSHDESVITNATTMSPSSPKPAADYSGLSRYYSGLPGNPKLLARSNDDPVPVQRDETFPLYKQLSNVGSHKIVQIFDSGPREDIRKILHNHEIPWLTVNVIRIGYSTTAAQNPVVLLVTAKEGTNPLQAQDAAIDCRDCLTSYQIHDIHAEFMEMQKSESYSKYVSDDFCLPDRPYKLVPPIGASIGPRLDGEYQASGSLGLYLQVKPRITEHTSWQQCGLTCHHVVFPRGGKPPPNGPGKSFHGENNVRVFVDNPSTADHKLSVSDLKSIKMEYQDDVDKLATRRHLAEQGMEKPLNFKELSLLQQFEAQVAELSGEESAIESFNRGLGEVIATSGVKTNGGSEPLLDWALFKLDESRFPEAVVNSVPPFTFSTRDVSNMNLGLSSSDRFNPKRFKLDVTQTIPLSEIQSPRVLNTDGFPSYRMLKFGRTTGWTVGVSNEIKSDLNRESGVISKEWCILDKSVLPHQLFSEKGDSGSFVFDFKGRLGGMMHGGDENWLAPMTYVTHVDHLFGSIKEEFDIKLE